MACANNVPKFRCTYTAIEDVAIARLYISVSTDPIVGAEQEVGKY